MSRDFEPLSRRVIGACIDVQRSLGIHCMEVDYQRALALALRELDIDFEREVEIPIEYKGVMVTRRRVDFVIRDQTHEIILETKARHVILDEDVEQCLLYLHQGGYQVCLLVNFGQKPLGIRRFVHTLGRGKDDTGEGCLDDESVRVTKNTKGCAGRDLFAPFAVFRVFAVQNLRRRETLAVLYLYDVLRLH